MARNKPKTETTDKQTDEEQDDAFELDKDDGEQPPVDAEDLPPVEPVAVGTTDPATASALIPGGAAGVIEDAERTIGGARSQSTASSFLHAAGGDGPKVAKFLVVNGGRILLGGCITSIKAGKMVDSTTYDLDELRRQGIVLQPVE